MSDAPERPLARVLLFSAVLIALGLAGVELGLRALWFQRHSEHALAIGQALATARQLLARPAPVGIWRTDPRLGYTHVPGSNGIHRTADFAASYTIDERGERAMPVPAAPRGEVWWLGGSYTFGHGVEDTESFAARLAAGPWRAWRVRNRAVMGWGTVHAYLRLRDALASEPPPALVLYAMIEAHVGRNSIRRSWIETLTAYDRLHPHVALEDGRLVEHGVIDEGAALPDSPGLRERELELTRALIEGMAAACAEASVPFAVVLLDDDWSVPVVRLLAETGVPLLDLSQVPIEGFASDRHPTPDDHARLARAIEASFVGRFLAEGGPLSP